MAVEWVSEGSHEWLLPGSPEANAPDKARAADLSDLGSDFSVHLLEDRRVGRVADLLAHRFVDGDRVCAQGGLFS